MITIAALAGCRRDASSGRAAPSATVFVPKPAASGPGTPRPGMAWIPPGVLRAGTPPDRTPRIADEELPHEERQMSGFYIDLYPYPDEAGAIPTTNVTRDEAARTCEAKGKRLCTELEWERACKGPENATYEYGDAYRAASCGTGVAVEEGARRPTGDHVACKSGFGVVDMHGGPWEWTDSRWQRGPSAGAAGAGRDGGVRDLAVLRGGNAALGELVGRCANARGSPSSTRALTVGFRCCAGARNAAEVVLPVDARPVLERLKDTAAIVKLLGADGAKAWTGAEIPASDYAFPEAWAWRPVPHDELTVLLGCTRETTPRCGAIVARIVEDHATVLASFTGGGIPPTLTPIDHGLRGRGFRRAGAYHHVTRYAFGRVQVVDEPVNIP